MHTNSPYSLCLEMILFAMDNFFLNLYNKVIQINIKPILRSFNVEYDLPIVICDITYIRYH